MCLKNFKTHMKTSVSEFIFLIKLYTEDMQLYWKETPTHVFHVNIAKPFYRKYQDDFFCSL